MVTRRITPVWTHRPVRLAANLFAASLVYFESALRVAGGQARTPNEVSNGRRTVTPEKAPAQRGEGFIA